MVGGCGDTGCFVITSTLSPDTVVESEKVLGETIGFTDVDWALQFAHGVVVVIQTDSTT
jgi:hypothetical protein